MFRFIRQYRLTLIYLYTHFMWDLVTINVAHYKHLGHIMIPYNIIVVPWYISCCALTPVFTTH